MKHHFMVHHHNLVFLFKCRYINFKIFLKFLDNNDLYVGSFIHYLSNVSLFIKTKKIQYYNKIISIVIIS